MSAMYYLNRGGAPEGPFEEARLVYMIQSGELTQGGVCPVGHNQWQPLNAVPALAQALAQRGAPPAQPYGAQPYGAQPYGAQPGYAPQQQPGYAPQAPYAQPAPRPGAAAPAKSNRGLIFAALGAFALLLIGGTVLGAYLMFFSSGGARSIEKSVPRDSEFLIEVPSVHQLVSDLHDVQYLDTSLRDDKQVFESAADSLSKAFDISQADAIALLASSETFGISGRKLSTTPEVVLALGMKNSSPVETLLKSPRFVVSGAVGQTGKRYQLTHKELQPSVAQDPILNGLAEAQVGSSSEKVLVWFPKAKLLTIGTEQLVADLAQVLESSAAAIDQNPSFQAANKDFDGSTRLKMFFDPNLFSTITDPKVKDLVDQYFKPAGPITGSLRVVPTGFVTRFTGRITGSKLPRATAYEAAQALDMGSRLPEETLSYMAASTRSKLTGVDMEKLMLDQVGAVEPRSRVQIEQGLRQMETLLGVSASKLIDGIGGQSVLGLSATPGISLDALGAGPQALTQFNLTWVLELKDATEYKKLAAQLKTKLLPGFREVTVTEDGAGFSVAPRGLLLPVSARVKFFDKYLFVTAGSNTLCDRAEAAFTKGVRTLKDDAAHKASLATLPDTQHFLLWVDSGRIADALLKSAFVRAQLAQSGMSLDKIKLTGPERVVSALSVRSEVKDEVWTYQLDALNAQALAPLGAGGAMLSGGVAHLPGL